VVLLGVDTSGAQGSLALAKLDRKATQPHLIELKQVTWDKRASHSEVAIVELQKLLNHSQLDLGQVTHLVVNLGPGSFTGLRVGLNLVRTLAYSLNLQVATCSSLASLTFANCAHTRVPGSLFIALKAVQNYYYAAKYRWKSDRLETEMQPLSVTNEQLSELSRGCAKVWIQGSTPEFSVQSAAKDLVELWLAAENYRNFVQWKSVEPLYIRASEAEEKLKKQLLKPV
jgi:tRNA threonylcarbamoyladenosine biosynthesis protein TsaB